ncbi:hypothetical protein HUJ04_007485 [Dendroctonus ponderosae]|nr:hypothetical protein HUJ04_007485 [Dendroctonus ponderosae]KAH1025522.1 hypothetical protein HUJ05_010231 [Dendroctonus ponderosae]
MPKKSKKGKTSTETTQKGVEGSASYAELILLDPNFHQSTSKFEFSNGDTYQGEYCAHASGLVWRQGHGTYTTKDGQIYTGKWDGDKLVENEDVEIVYPGGVKYYGSLLKNQYTGPGVYHLEDNVSLICNFADNIPTGEVTLIDPNGNAWHGFAEKDDSLLIKEHPFYRNISKDLGKALPKQTHISKMSIQASKKSDVESKTSLKYRDLRSLEKEIFAKSKKTPSGVDSSDWYQDYVTYCDTYGGIIHKVKTIGESTLTSEEYDWYAKYKEFEKKYLHLLKAHKIGKKNSKPLVDNKFFELIHSQEYKAMNKPIPVFYANAEEDGE